MTDMQPESTIENSQQAPDIALPMHRMITRAAFAAAGLMVLAGALAAILNPAALAGVLVGGVVPFFASAGSLLIISPTKTRSILEWPKLLFAAQAISLTIAATIALALLYSSAQPSKIAALPTAALVFITVWIVFAKAYGVAASGSQSD